MKSRMLILSAMALGLTCGFHAIGAPFDRTTQGIVPPGCGRVQGRIVDQNGQPIEGVRVYSSVNDRPSRGRLNEARTDADGRFTLDCAEPGGNGVYLSKEEDGYPDTLYTPFVDRGMIPTVKVIDRETVGGIEIRLGPKSGRLDIHVVDSSTLRPVENAKLIFCRADDPSQCSWRGFSPTGGVSMLLAPIPICIKIEAPEYDDWFYRKEQSQGRKISDTEVPIQGGLAAPLQVRAMETKSLVVPLRRTKK